MKLKEIFKDYESPTNEAGWESIAKDPAVKQYNRQCLTRRMVGYSAAVLTTAAVVTIATVLATGDKAPQSTPAAKETSVATEPNTAVSTETAVSTSADKTITTAVSNTEVPVSVTTESATTAATASTTVVATNAVTTPAVIGVPTKNTTNATPAAPAPQAAKAASVTSTAPAKSTTTSAKVETNPSSASQPKSTLPEEPDNEDNGTLYIPNAFSPNGDGLNDLFFVKADFEPESFEMAIYTRKGELVFVSKDIKIGWDGMRYGSQLPFDIYTYVIKYSDQQGKPQSRRGQITLLK